MSTHHIADDPKYGQAALSRGEAERIAAKLATLPLANLAAIAPLMAPAKLAKGRRTI